jgi:hypothetical protein
MKLIPPFLESSTSRAEEKLFDILQGIDIDEFSTALHSLNLSHHQHKLMGELDFVLIGKAGVVVLEVKGGGVRVSQGIWHFRDRYGVEHRKSEGPFDQASSGMFSLLKSLKEHVAELDRVHIPIGYGVAFPDIEFQQDSVEWPLEVVLDARTLRTPVGMRHYLTRLARYWREKGAYRAQLDKAEISAIVRYLRPDFEIIPTLSQRAESLDHQTTRLTGEQMDALDGLEENRRFICEGGAGTGKTFLAVEVGRRLASEGVNVVFTCLSPVLGRYISTRCQPGVAVVPFSEFQRVKSDTIDVLIVDEGQDVLNLDSFAEMDRVLKGGLEQGRWRIFLDRNAQAGLCGKYEPEAFEYLLQCNPALYKLRRNCRNTDEIVKQTQLCTGADLGAPQAGAGMPVKIEYYADREAGVTMLANLLSDFKRKGIAPADLTILSGKPFSLSLAGQLPEAIRQQIVTVDITNSGSFPLTRASFSTVEDFKGLENRFIVATDCDDFNDRPRAVARLYTAMSRARVMLTLFLPDSLRATMRELQLGNLELMGLTVQR